MRKIAVFSGTRSEYGILYWILKGLQQAKEIELQLLVGGTHLSAEYGSTIRTIEEDGFQVTERVDFLLDSDTPQAMTQSLASALACAADVFARCQPELLVLLGDRFELLAMAQAAMLARIPVAHIHGGEVTEGAVDDAVRHCVTKMSHLHFAATEVYRQRIVQLGEDPGRVFNYGAPGLDNIRKLPLMSLAELADELDFELNAPFFLLTYHPVTLDDDLGEAACINLFRALEQFPEMKVIATYPNADAGGRRLIQHLLAYQAKNPERVFLTPSLGQVRYLSAMKHCAAVIGNSSSGLIEAPAFRVPTVNIGNRQKGRIQAQTVLAADESTHSIISALREALSASFAEQCKIADNPYGEGEASDKIVDKLRSVDLKGLVCKRFHDLPLAHASTRRNG